MNSSRIDIVISLILVSVAIAAIILLFMYNQGLQWGFNSACHIEDSPVVCEPVSVPVLIESRTTNAAYESGYRIFCERYQIEGCEVNFSDER